MPPPPPPMADYEFNSTEIGQLVTFYSTTDTPYTYSEIEEVIDQTNTSAKAKRTRIMLLKLLAAVLANL